jgi:hypothetical protein
MVIIYASSGLVSLNLTTDNAQQLNDQSVMLLAVYNSASAAALAKEQLHDLNCSLFECPGHRLIVRYNSRLIGATFSPCAASPADL